MNPIHDISRAEARSIILNAQALHRPNPFGTGPGSVIKAIEHLGYVQLDTISVVERAHHHVLWSRIPAYQQDWLTQTQLKDRKVFEYWAHAASYLPMSEYRYSLPVMIAFRDQKDGWPKSSIDDMKYVLDRIRAEGPLMSRDFESNHKGGNWWDWKPPKWALQRLFLEGQLMVSHRENFQRVYDLPERIIPAGTDTSLPNQREYYAHHIKRTLQAQGLAARSDLIHLREISHKVFDQTLQDLQEEGEVRAVSIEGNKKYYTLPSYDSLKAKLNERILFLSPFDNSVIWRKRLQEIFNFDYTLECYLPAHKRAYGYFCLPVLYQDQLTGLIDLKSNRKDRVLEIQNIFWDEGWEHLTDHPAFDVALLDIASFNGCDDITFK